jgi:hypothetical protein
MLPTSAYWPTYLTTSRNEAFGFVCRRFAAIVLIGGWILGLTPQAMYLSPLRGCLPVDGKSGPVTSLPECVQEKGGALAPPVIPET